MNSMLSGPDLDACLADLDQADHAVRALYRQLADDPDRAGEYEVGLRELLAKRLELARCAGLAALNIWRASASSAITQSPRTDAAPAEASEPGGASEPEGAAAPVALETSERGGRNAVVVAEVEAPSVPTPPASDAQLAQWKEAVQSKGLAVTLASAQSAQRPWGITLHEMMCLLGPPMRTST